MCRNFANRCDMVGMDGRCIDEQTDRKLPSNYGI